MSRIQISAGDLERASEAGTAADRGSVAASRIVPIGAVRFHAVEELLDHAFGPDRHKRTAYRLRDRSQVIAALSFALLEAGRLVASLQSWPVLLAGENGTEVLLTLVGPIAVVPDRQRQGHGRALLKKMLTEADRTGAPPQVLIGDAPFYVPFGFSAAPTGDWRLPGPNDPARLLLRNPLKIPLPRAGELRPGRTA